MASRCAIARTGSPNCSSIRRPIRSDAPPRFEKRARATTSPTSKLSTIRSSSWHSCRRQYVERFRFNLAGLDKSLGPDVRIVRFVEFRRPTMLKLNANADLFSRGLIWIEKGQVALSRRNCN